MSVDERHENEQYFFDESTLGVLSDFVSQWQHPCVLCAPRLGARLADTGVQVAILDIDQRFATSPGFVSYEIERPHWIDTRFDLIVCDPPFFNVSLSRLFAAIRMLSHNDFSQQLVLGYLERRSEAILRAFAPFGLEPTGFRPTYDTVQPVERNDIQFYSNLAPDRVQQLRSLAERQDHE